jgi:hypothetical protein
MQFYSGSLMHFLSGVDKYYKGMSQTRLTMIQSLNNAAIALPPVKTYTFRSNLPSLLCRKRSKRWCRKLRYSGAAISG